MLAATSWGIRNIPLDGDAQTLMLTRYRRKHTQEKQDYIRSSQLSCIIATGWGRPIAAMFSDTRREGGRKGEKGREEGKKGRGREGRKGRKKREKEARNLDFYEKLPKAIQPNGS